MNTLSPVGNPDDLFKMFIYCYVDSGMFKLTDIISQEMFDLLTSWKEELFDLFPREVEPVSLIKYQDTHGFLYWHKPAHVYTKKLKITILEQE